MKCVLSLDRYFMTIIRLVCNQISLVVAHFTVYISFIIYVTTFHLKYFGTIF